MKLIATIILIFLSNLVFSQTKLDSLVFKKINEYRKSKGVSELKWDTSAYKAANHHSKYLRETNNVGHKENDNRFETSQLRYIYYGGKPHSFIGECCVGFNKNYNVEDYDKLSISILEIWINSPRHNDILLESDATSASVSILNKITNCGLRNWNNYEIFGTLILSE